LPSVAGPAATLAETMRYAVLGGGKRVRPLLAYASGEFAHADVAVVDAVAAAVEMIHAYSLIHDDLPAMDDDDLRRGIPTSHVKYGENVAILAGDGLFAEAVRLVCEEQEGDPETIVTAVAELMAAAGVEGMVGGQYLDVAGSAESGSDEDRLLEIHSLKTGRLIAASVGVVMTLGRVE
jgi:geranylgeranyl diphosphate synthase type II